MLLNDKLHTLCSSSDMIWITTMGGQVSRMTDQKCVKDFSRKA
jgi:hypothetical protein